MKLLNIPSKMRILQNKIVKISKRKVRNLFLRTRTRFLLLQSRHPVARIQTEFLDKMKLLQQRIGRIIVVMCGGQL